jgi:hypothetical protein
VEKCCSPRQATDDNAIRRMRVACWITKATETRSEYLILLACPRQGLLCESASIFTSTFLVLLKIIKVTFKLHEGRVDVVQTESNKSRLTISSVEQKYQI